MREIKFKSKEEIELDERLEELSIENVSDVDKEKILSINKDIKNRKIRGYFKVEDLYYEWEWKNKTVGQRISIGIEFKKYVDKGLFKDVVVDSEKANTTIIYAIDSTMYRYAKAKERGLGSIIELQNQQLF